MATTRIMSIHVNKGKIPQRRARFIPFILYYPSFNVVSV